MNVFFYGLFMDKDRLAEKSIVPSNAVIGYVDGFRIRIGDRATLQRCVGARAYGVMMEVSLDELTQLYAESSVADYLPEPVTVELADGSHAEASCYNLADNKIAGFNQTYAEALLQVAKQVGLPDSYLRQISQAGIARP